MDPVREDGQRNHWVSLSERAGGGTGEPGSKTLCWFVALLEPPVGSEGVDDGHGTVRGGGSHRRGDQHSIIYNVIKI